MSVAIDNPADSVIPKHLRPEAPDRMVLMALVVGFLALFLPTYIELSTTVWASDEQGHGPIILAVAF